MKILFVGINSYYTIANLSRAIRENLKGIEIYTANPIMPDGSEISEEEGEAFDGIERIPLRSEITLSRDEMVRGFGSIIAKKKYLKLILRNLFTFRFKSIYQLIEEESTEKKYSGIMTGIYDKYDVIQFHFISPKYIESLKYVPEKKKVVFTVWGSDILQIHGRKNFEVQYAGIKRSDVVVINTPEMQELFKVKFGHHLSHKIKTAYFILSGKKFELLEQTVNQNQVREYKEKYGIDNDKTIITLGYNGSPKQRHLEILEILNALEESVKKKFHVMIPLAYGLPAENSYLKSIEDLCCRVDFSTDLILDYMKGDALSQFTAASEIFLNLRETDCLNAAMIETLYSGNIVINGSWLPYGTLRRRGVYYKELERLEDLNMMVPEVLNKLPEERIKAGNNKKIIREFFDNRRLIKDWEKVYSSLGTV